MQDLNTIQTVAITVLPLLFAITLHEMAHGWMADRLGDPTARMLGRVTLNPLKHIDPIGTVALPLGLLLVSALAHTPPFIFGWAKPVPITARNLHNPRRDMALVAAAGPAANFLMAVLWVLAVKLGVTLGGTLPGMAAPVFYMGIAGVTVNLVFMVLNLFPLPPLDGGRVLASLLPPRVAWQLGRIEPYGIMILLLLLVTGVLWSILAPIMGFFNRALFSLIGLG